MVALTRKRKAIQLLSPEPEPEPEPEALPPLLLTPLPQHDPNTSTNQIKQRVWSKFDVIVIIKGMVNYIAEMSVDPMSNLDEFIEFINKNSSSSSYKAYDCSKVTWNLEKNGVDNEKNFSLHLESRKLDDLGKKNDGGCGFGDKVLNLGMNDCRVSCLSEKDSFVSDVRVLNLGMNDGGGVKNKKKKRKRKKKKKISVDNVSNSGKNDGGSGFGDGRVLNLGMNDGGGVKKKKKKKKKINVDNVSNSGKNDGGSGFGDGRVLNLGMNDGSASVVENLSNSGKNDGGVSCLGNVNNGKKIGVCEEKVNCIEKVGGNKCVGSRKDLEESKVHGNIQNGGCASLSDFGCWGNNEVTLIEAVRQMILRRLSLKVVSQTDLLWCPPRIGVLKWNTDASVRIYGNKAAIGGVLRDWNGSFRCVFSCPLDCCESNEAEVRAIYRALEIASCKDWLLNLHMVIESDSLNAVRWCNGNSGAPLNLSYMLAFIRECIKWWPGLEITYAGRNSNSVADYLSKKGHEMSADFVAWM